MTHTTSMYDIVKGVFVNLQHQHPVLFSIFYIAAHVAVKGVERAKGTRGRGFRRVSV